MVRDAGRVKETNTNTIPAKERMKVVVDFVVEQGVTIVKLRSVFELVV